MTLVLVAILQQLLQQPLFFFFLLDLSSKSESISAMLNIELDKEVPVSSGPLFGFLLANLSLVVLLAM